VPDDLIRRIRAHRDTMSPGYRRVADYLVEHYQDAAFRSAAWVASAAGVSESLVVRFASSLDYTGFRELSGALEAMVKARLSLPDRLRRAQPALTADTPAAELLAHVVSLDFRNLEETLAGAIADTLDAAVTALLGARTLYLVGLRGSAHLAGLFGVLLDKAGADVRVVTQGDVVMFDRLRPIGPDDVMFAFSFARYTRRSLEALRLARDRGATTIVMTDAPTSPVVGHGDLVLNVRVASASFQHSYVAAITVMNALVAAWALRAPDRSLASLEAIEAVIPPDAFLT
jgi:DNA-binding MurR/RpiR family transcriptional regulator